MFTTWFNFISLSKISNLNFGSVLFYFEPLFFKCNNLLNFNELFVNFLKFSSLMLFKPFSRKEIGFIFVKNNKVAFRLFRKKKARFNVRSVNKHNKHLKTAQLLERDRRSPKFVKLFRI